MHILLYFIDSLAWFYNTEITVLIDSIKKQNSGSEAGCFTEIQLASSWIMRAHRGLETPLYSTLCIHSAI